MVFLEQAFRRAQQSPEYQAYLVSQASLPGGISSGELIAQTQGEQAYWQRVTQKAGIEPL